MTAFHIVRPAPEVWDSFVIDHPQAHVLQLPAWGALKTRFGWTADTVALRNEQGVIHAGALILFSALPFRLGTLAYIPKGPLAPADWWPDPARMKPLWDAIHVIAGRHGARWLTLEGPDPAPGGPCAETTQTALEAARFHPAPRGIQPVRTIAIPLAGSDDDILARMKQKTRYNIRLSERKGVTVRQGTRQDVDSFNRMLAVTGDRDEFGVHDPAYYQAAYDLFATQGHAALFIASYNGQDLAGIMVFALGETAWYLYGASTNEERNRMPTYAVQWAAIQWAKARGCTTYDLWGVPDKDEATLEAGFTDRSDGLWGVYRTKRGYGGEVVRRLPAYDHVYNPLVYRLYQSYLGLRSTDQS